MIAGERRALEYRRASSRDVAAWSVSSSARSVERRAAAAAEREERAAARWDTIELALVVIVALAGALAVGYTAVILAAVLR